MAVEQVGGAAGQDGGYATLQAGLYTVEVKQVVAGMDVLLQALHATDNCFVHVAGDCK